jgi:hypothetical protein
MVVVLCSQGLWSYRKHRALLRRYVCWRQRGQGCSGDNGSNLVLCVAGDVVSVSTPLRCAVPGVKRSQGAPPPSGSFFPVSGQARLLLLSCNYLNWRAGPFACLYLKPNNRGGATYMLPWLQLATPPVHHSISQFLPCFIHSLVTMNPAY